MTEIESIKINLGEKKLDLTLAEAKDVQNVLNETFPDLQKPMEINPVIIKFVRDYGRYYVSCMPNYLPVCSDWRVTSSTDDRTAIKWSV